MDTVNYLCCFHCLFADNWGTFADCLNVIAVIGLGVVVLCADRRRHNESQQLQKDINRPILVFKMLPEDKDSYKIVNLGKGSALNIVVAYKTKPKGEIIDTDWEGEDRDCKGKEKKIVNCYSLGEAEPLLLCWKKGGHRWIARYENIFGKKYYTICEEDTLIIIDHINDKNDTGKSEKIVECDALEKYITKYTSDTTKITRLWTILKENDDCKK